MIAAVAAYIVRTIGIPSGAVALGLADESNGSLTVSKPPTLALGRNGTLAIVLAPVDAASLGTSVLIARSDDSRAILALPGGSMSGSCEPRRAGTPVSYQNAHIDAVAVARDGTPFVSMSCVNAGAFISVPKTSALWNGNGWHRTAADAIPLNPANRAVSAADTPTDAVYNGDYSYTFANLDELQNTPHYQENETGYTHAGHGYSLGFGTSLGMRGRYVAGFTAGLNPMVPDNAHPRAATALEWADGRRRELGPGIAYDVNGAGAAVGDDEGTFGASDRHPVLWKRGITTRLSALRGSAYAISDDGTIVGTIDGRGFVISGGDVGRRVRYLDDLLPGGAWHVTSAYGIAANGRILAVGSRHHGSAQVLLLDPATP